jgi:hypothetical protein
MNPNFNEIYYYFRKWNEIILSTNRIERNKIPPLVNKVYKSLGLSDVSLINLSSPNDISLDLQDSLRSSSVIQLKLALKEELTRSIIAKNKNYYYTLKECWKYINVIRISDVYQSFFYIIFSNFYNFLDECFFYGSFESEFSSGNPFFYDFYINCVSDDCDLEIWNLWKSLCKESPYLLAFNDVCLIIDRPTELHLDRELRPHQDGEAAIRFGDNYKIHCNHGIIIPENLGKISCSNWQPAWILNESKNDTDEDLINTLSVHIGYKKFQQEFLDNKKMYWKNHEILREQAVLEIINWQYFHYGNLYRKIVNSNKAVQTQLTIEELIKKFSIKLSHELRDIYQSYYTGRHQIASGLNFYRIEEAIENPTLGLESYPVRLFYGDRQEIYYVLCDNQERMISHVYCKFPGEEPVIYAECITSLIVTIAQCYQEGAYYIAIDEETGERTIEQDLDKIEPIFEKFNPDQIDNWRKIWKS